MNTQNHHPSGDWCAVGVLPTCLGVFSANKHQQYWVDDRGTIAEGGKSLQHPAFFLHLVWVLTGISVLLEGCYPARDDLLPPELEVNAVQSKVNLEM